MLEASGGGGGGVKGWGCQGRIVVTARRNLRNRMGDCRRYRCRRAGLAANQPKAIVNSRGDPGRRRAKRGIQIYRFGLAVSRKFRGSDSSAVLRREGSFEHSRWAHNVR